METKTNIFFHAPKELTTDAFLVWLIYFLDSEEENKEYKQTFFDSLISKKEDCGRTIGSIELKNTPGSVPLCTQDKIHFWLTPTLKLCNLLKYRRLTIQTPTLTLT